MAMLVYQRVLMKLYSLERSRRRDGKVWLVVPCVPAKMCQVEYVWSPKEWVVSQRISMLLVNFPQSVESFGLPGLPPVFFLDPGVL